MELLERALAFAAERHAGQTRKLARIPYILHPMEVACIIATLTTDCEVIAAGLLHDTVEDTNTLPEEIRENFGPRVAALVASETEDKLSSRPAAETWKERKEDSLLMLRHTSDRDVKLLWMADKLSNLRSFYRGYLQFGEDLWDHFNQKDPHMQKWYYDTIASYLKELSGTAAYIEFVELKQKLFDRYEKE